ncbi:AIPR family protein [Mesorhizobium sp. M1143]|uniref:AIPR family protein n=1 Tax=Mesorhizobium sp. M1143 TaxID=2957061 RepID=UPI00333967BC
MTENYKALIDVVIAARKADLQSDDSEAFENIVNGLVLEPFDLNVDEIETGITDGNGDGQIDAMFVLANGTLLSSENADELPPKGPIEIDVALIQAKNTNGFEETPLKLIRSTVADLLKLDQPYPKYLASYSELLQDKFRTLRNVIIASAGRTAKVRVRVYYATKASTENIHPTVLATGKALSGDLSSLVATSDVQLTYLGAKELIDLSRLPKTRKRDLGFQEALSSGDGRTFACLVSIDALMAFLSDENGDLIRPLFDANVRDFLGKTDVNQAIRETLETLEGEDFWWFNNGITIVASHVDQKGKRLVLDDPLLVNGLQTSNVIHAFIRDPTVKETVKSNILSKSVLIRIIEPPTEKVRDEIIKATNSQTHIPKAYLRGMDSIHRNIEDHFRHAGVYYERRKNQYRNAGYPRSSIVTLSELAQSVMSAFLFRGADARGRPTSLLKSDTDYALLFNDKVPLESYRNVIAVKHEIVVKLAMLFPDRGSAFRNDVVFHILAYSSARRFHNHVHAAMTFKGDPENLDDDIVTVVDLFLQEGGTDRVAKSPSFEDQIKEAAIAKRNAAKK